MQPMEKQKEYLMGIERALNHLSQKEKTGKQKRCILYEERVKKKIIQAGETKKCNHFQNTKMKNVPSV